MAEENEIPTNARTGEPLKWASYTGDGSERYHGVPMRDLTEADRKALSDAGETELIEAVESGSLYRMTPRAKAAAASDEDESSGKTKAPASTDTATPAATTATTSPARSGRAASTSGKEGDS